MDDADHGQCEVTIQDGTETHACRPLCPHGLEKGYQIRLTGFEEVDSRQRRVKLATVDGLTCASPYHEQALARMGGR